MPRLDTTIERVTARIAERSRDSRQQYLGRMRRASEEGVAPAHLSCGNIAHAFASSAPGDKSVQVAGTAGNIGIITAYNDMLSAHKPYERFPETIREAARRAGGTAQVAGGVPAMCDGVTQGRPGMELSLFSRDVIALAASVALSHNVYDTTVYLGICDKIVPGLLIAAATFGHLPAVFIPAGPMTSGMPNDEKSRIRRDFASGKCDRATLLRAEMASYHGPGTCTFYGTANSNQMLMEFMGLHLPGASFVNPGTELRNALTEAAVRRALEISGRGNDCTPVCDILDERAFVNGIVGLHATGGSTNLLIHLVAVARAAGIVLEMEDFADVSAVTPLLARIYPNGLADVNHFHAAGGLALVIRELLSEGLLHPETRTVAGTGLQAYTREPLLDGAGDLSWRDGAAESLNRGIVRTGDDPFMRAGGLTCLSGTLGSAVMKISAVPEEHRSITAPARVFDDQDSVREAFRAGELDKDAVIVVRYQGPRANGMPELHGLTPVLSALQGRGHRVALLTDGRMSGASGQVPAAIHAHPEALENGPIAHIRDGDMLAIDGDEGRMDNVTEFAGRTPGPPPARENYGCGRGLFEVFRERTRPAAEGAGFL